MNEHLAAFVGYLTDKEKSKSTIESYTRYVKKFLEYVDGNEITKELVIQTGSYWSVKALRIPRLT